MSQKKRKSRSGGGYSGGKNPNELQQTSKSKRLKPISRNLLCIDLVMLAASEWMVRENMLSDATANMIAILGVVMMLAALYLQFGAPKGKRL